MSTKVIMPQMGESIFEGTITKWLKQVGDKVERDEPLFEISTDKVDSEIPSPAEGVLSEILVSEGTTVQINTVVAVIDGEAGTAAKTPAPEQRPRPVEAPPAPEPSLRGTKPAVPKLEAVKPVPAPSDEERAHLSVQAKPSPAPSSVQPTDIRTSPLVRRLAREHDVDLSKIRGSGLEGRITKQDVLEYVDSRSKAPAEEETLEPEAPAREPQAPPASQAEIPQPAEAAAETRAEPAFAGESEIVPMPLMRKSIAEHMVLSKRTSAHVNTVFEVEMTPIVALREQHKRDFEKREGIKLTFTPFFAKALVDTVREFPVFNCSVSGNNIVYKKPINVGIAVALENGLIVPVIKDAHLKSFTGLALAITDLAFRARTRRLKPDEVQNGTISITNPGPYGALFGTPVINQPQVAILGIGGIEKRPVVVNDAIAIRSMVYLSLTFDHRVIDGAVADQFMAKLKDRLQNWSQWVA